MATEQCPKIITLVEDGVEGVILYRPIILHIVSDTEYTWKTFE